MNATNIRSFVKICIFEQQKITLLIMDERFNDIRCYDNQEIPQAFARLLGVEELVAKLPMFFPNIPKEVLVNEIAKLTTVRDFQKNFVLPFLSGLEAKTSNGVSLHNLDRLNKKKPCLFLSNHRDIVLDSAFLNIHLLMAGYDTTEIAIGDNLLIFPWIEDLVRINKSFIVRRNVSVREQIRISHELSSYIRYVLTEKKQSVWMAQREGRAKDSDDRTQPALLKMLQMSAKNGFIDGINELNIVPLAINYEFDPCDYLKAKEFQQKRDNPEFKKSPADDLLNMSTGLSGYKGRISYVFGTPLNENVALHSAADYSSKEQVVYVAQLIDNEIHKNYLLYPINYIAADILNSNNFYANNYTLTQKTETVEYFQKQIDKIDLPNKDIQFLMEKIVEMYANPVINQQKARTA